MTAWCSILIYFFHILISLSLSPLLFLLLPATFSAMCWGVGVEEEEDGESVACNDVSEGWANKSDNLASSHWAGHCGLLLKSRTRSDEAEFFSSLFFFLFWESASHTISPCLHVKLFQLRSNYLSIGRATMWDINRAKCASCTCAASLLSLSLNVVLYIFNLFLLLFVIHASATSNKFSLFFLHSSFTDTPPSSLWDMLSETNVRWHCSPRISSYASLMLLCDRSSVCSVVEAHSALLINVNAALSNAFLLK